MKKTSLFLSILAVATMGVSFTACDQLMNLLNPPASSVESSVSESTSESVSSSEGPTFGTEENPEALTVPGSITVSYAKNADPVWYTFTATEDKTLGVTLSAGAIMGYGVDKADMAYTDGETYFEFELTTGTTYFVNFSTQDLSAGQIKVEADYVVVEEKITLSGTYIGEDEWNGSKSLTVVIVADEDELGGKVTFIRSSYTGAIVENYIFEIVDGELVLLNEDGSSLNTAMTNLVLKDGVPVSAVSNGTNYKLSEGEPIAPPTGFEGDYVVSVDEYETWEMRVTSTHIALEITENGVSKIIASAYTVEDGEIVLDSDGDLNAYQFTITDGKITAIVDTEKSETYEVTNEKDVAPKADGSENKPYPITLPCEEEADPGEVKKTWYAFTAEETGILTVTYPDENSWLELKDGVHESVTKFSQQTTTFEIFAGNEYKLGLGVWSKQDSAPTVSISFEAQALAVEGDFEKPFTISPYGVTTKAFAATEDADKYIWFAYEPWGDGTATFTFTGGAVNVKFSDGENEPASFAGVEQVEVEVEGSTKYYLGVQTADLAAGTIKFSVKYKEATGTSAANPTPVEIPTTATSFKAEGNSLNQKWYTFTAEANGFLVVTYPTNNSNVAYMQTNGREVYKGKETTYRLVTYAGETYKLGLGVSEQGTEDFDVTVVFEEGEVPYLGDFGLPIEAGNWEANVYEFKETDAADRYVWFTFNPYERGNLTLTFTEEVNVKYGLSADALTEVSNQKTVTFAVELKSLYYIGVQKINAASTSVSFNAEISRAPGSDFEHPIQAVIGENSYNLPEGQDGYFVYQPTADGTLTITVESDNEDAYISYYPSAESFEMLQAFAGQTVSISVTAGTDVELILSTAPDFYTAGVAATITFTAAFTAAA